MSAGTAPPALTGIPGAEGARRIGRLAKGALSRVRRAARLLLPASANVRRPPMRIRAGRRFTDAKARRLPIVVFVAQGLGAGAAEDLAREVELAQLSTRSFRPLFVIDSADFAPFRHRGYVVERVMPAEELAAVNPEDDHGEYVYSRIAAIARGYRAASVVPVPAGSLDAMRGSLLRLVGAVPTETVAPSAES